jgi:DNA helicase HerA-like ATPase
MAERVSAGLHGVLKTLDEDESAVLQWVIGPSQRRDTQPSNPPNVSELLGLQRIPQVRPEHQQHWRKKTSEPLFAVHGRVGARAPSVRRIKMIIRTMAQATSLMNASHSQVRHDRPTRRSARTLASVPLHQRWSGIINAAELAALIGYPFDEAGYFTSRALQAPGSLLFPHAPHPEVPVSRILGRSLHPADDQRLVALPVETALHHLHVTGVTGSGKSTQLASFIRADMAAGRSVLLIEPRGDLVEDVLKAVPVGRRDDVVIIEPGGADQVAGINPLAGPLEGAEHRADLMMHLFRRIFGTAIGPRSGDVLLHALIALARKRDGTLADLPVLLTSGAFRRQVLTEVRDPLVLAPFFAWYDGLSDPERAQVIAPVLNKTRAFLSRSTIRRLLGQAAPRFNLDDLFSKRSIVLVNLNTGLIGAETASLIGATILTQLWQAILRRASVPPAERHPVMVVVDEIQDFLKLPVDVGDLLAQARALGVSLTAAHQHLGQLSPSLKAAFFANARSRMAFHPSSDDVAPLAQVFGSATSAEDLEGLGRFEAYCRLLVDRAMTDPFIVRTQPLGAAVSKPDELRLLSQQRYGVSGSALDAALLAKWHRSSAADLDGLIGITPRKAS